MKLVEELKKQFEIGDYNDRQNLGNSQEAYRTNKEAHEVMLTRLFIDRLSEGELSKEEMVKAAQVLQNGIKILF